MMHPRVQTIATELETLIGDDLPPNEVAGLASLAAVLEIQQAAIMENGCNAAQAHSFGQIYARLRDGLSELDHDCHHTEAARILQQAGAAASATLALMPCEGAA
jgi:hypothetical protein